MIWEAIASSLGVTSILGGIKTARKKMSARKYKKLLAAAVAELIQLSPNINEAEAKIRAAEALGLDPSSELVVAQSMLEKVRAYETMGGRRGAKKKTAAKKKAAKKSAKKTVTKRSAAKKKAG